MTVRAIFTLAFPQKKFGFSGVGYNPTTGKLVYTTDNYNNCDNGTRVREDDEATPCLAALLYASCLCNNATLVQSVESSVAEGHTGGALSGQPTELALLVAAAKAGFDDPRPQYHRVQEIPFTSERKRMEVRARPVNGVHACNFFEMCASDRSAILDGSLYFVKGMPEKVISECSSFFGGNGLPIRLNDDHRAHALSHSRRLAASGLRVIAVAYGTSLGQLVFAGLVGMEDPPREGVEHSVQQLRKGGVKCFMISGDSKETSREFTIRFKLR